VVPFGLERQLSSGTARIIVRGELDLSTGLQLVLDADVRSREEGRTLIVLPGERSGDEPAERGRCEPRRILELAEVADRLNLED